MRARLPWILFAISLTLNIAIAGTIGWHVWHDNDDHMVDRSPVMRAAGALKLQAAQREKLDQFRQASRQSIEAMRQNVRPLRRAMIGELAKSKPDLAAVDQLIDQINGEEAKVQKTMARAFADFHASLTPEQRLEFRKTLRERAGGRFFDAIVNPEQQGGPGRGGPPRSRGPNDADAPPNGTAPAAPAPPPAVAPAPALAK